MEKYDQTIFWYGRDVAEEEVGRSQQSQQRRIYQCSCQLFVVALRILR